MTTRITKATSPEARELEKKKAELASLEARLGERELDLATLQAELRSFEGSYLRIVGSRLAELDEIEARIAEAASRNKPKDPAAQDRASQARAQAQESARAVEAEQEAGKREPFTPSENLKKLYREVAKRIHPDLATDEGERKRRHELMTEANQAYEEGDEARLEAILRDWESSPESVKGEGPGAELVRVIRKIAQVEDRLKAIDTEIARLKECDLHRLKKQVDQAKQEERDLLAEMAARVNQQVVEAQRTVKINDGTWHHFMSEDDNQVSHALVAVGTKALAVKSAALVERGLALAKSLQPTSAKDHYNLGVALHYRGDLDGAIAEYREALRLNPNDAPRSSDRRDTAHYKLAVASGEKGDWGLAIAEYCEVLRLDPSNDTAHYVLGHMLGSFGRWDEAISEYREALRLNPNNDMARNGLGFRLREEEDTDGEIEVYREALRLNPNDDFAHYRLGQALAEEKGDWDGAIAEYREALRVGPKNENAHNAHYSLGLALEHKHNFREALQEYRAAYELNPQDPDVRKAYEGLVKKTRQ